MENFDDYNFNFPGRVVEFFTETQTATVRISAERLDSTSEELDASKSRGLIEGVPVHVLSGGGWSLTMPIAVGDTCMIFFSQVGYDHWLYDDKDEAGKHEGEPMYWLKRKFDLQDGYAIVGLNTMKRVVSDYSDTHSQWRNADASQVISLNEDASIDITSTGIVAVEAPTVNVNASVEANIVSPTIKLVGNLEVTGNITTSGSVTASGDVEGSGTSLSGHVHLISSGSSAGITGSSL